MATGHMGHIWWLVGSIVMGYGGAMTLVSWAAAVAASAIAFGVAARDQYRCPQFLLASLAMSGGICAMHYLGMLALEMSLPIHWDWRLITVSALIAVLALAAALNLFRFLFTLSGKRLWLMQALAAVVMGAAICGLHYTGMSAAIYTSGSVCLSAGALNGPELASIIITSAADCRPVQHLAGCQAAIHRLSAQQVAAGKQCQAATGQ